MKLIYFRVLFLIALVTLALGSKADIYSDKTNVVCPDGWAASGAVIPPMLQAGNPWSANVADEQSVINYFNDKEPATTIDKLNPSAEDFAADLLTVASECLVYRNYELEANALGQSTPKPFDSSKGWLPRVVFSN